MNKKRIVILRHRQCHLFGYAIDHYALRWKQKGHSVTYHVGPGNIPDADVVIVDIDLTVVPQEYIEVIHDLPVAINGQILDISRRRFSQLALSRTDDYSGPVIVKTNRNYGGLPEREMVDGRSDAKSPFRWDTTKILNPFRYPIFENIKSVPNGVWENDELIVERFSNKPDGGLFYTHYCSFFGDKEIAGRIGSPHPIVKWENAISDEETPVPDEVRHWRKELKIDYGRFDYLKTEGKYVLIDVNKTEAGGIMCFQWPKEMDYLASGMECYIG